MPCTPTLLQFPQFPQLLHQPVAQVLAQETIAAITPDQALQVAQTYFLEPYLSLVGPEEEVNSGLLARQEKDLG
jgi:hypothetical protein